MIISIISSYTGLPNCMDLPITLKQIWLWKTKGQPLKKVFPHLSPVERIFLKTGMTEEEQKKYYNV